MLPLRRHDMDDYAKLPFIDDSKTGVLTQADIAFLDALGDLLAEHGATERFGASLLHSHFPLGADELMIEEADARQNVTTLQPKILSPDRLWPIHVRFSEQSESERSAELIGLEYSADLRGVAPIGPDDTALLDAIQALLAQHGMLDRFGVRLIYHPLQLDEDSVLLETVNSASRVLTCNVVSNTAPDFAQSIPTFFKWDVVPANFDVGGGVAQGCRVTTRCNVVQGCLDRPDGSGHESHSSHDMAPNHESDGEP